MALKFVSVQTATGWQESFLNTVCSATGAERGKTFNGKKNKAVILLLQSDNAFHCICLSTAIPGNSPKKNCF